MRAARQTFALPYFDAGMSITREPEGWVRFESQRLDRFGAPPAALDVRYRPSGPAVSGEPGSLEHFLVERYHLYSQRRGRLIRGRVDHPPWQLREARIDSVDTGLLAAEGIQVEGDPIAICSDGVRVAGFSPVEIGRAHV